MSAQDAAVPAIEVIGVTKRFGTVAAVNDLSFSVPRGSVTGFLGPNGAGKTTTMRIVLGLARPTGGVARIEGEPYASLADPLGTVGAALETTGFHPGRTAADHLRVACLEARLDQARAGAVLEQTGMSQFADVRVGRFSLGMKQRLAFATALLGEPDILVLDEPANGLDPAGVAWLRVFLRKFAERGGAVLVSSHLLAEIAEVADRVVVIDRGALVVADTVEKLVASSGETVLVRTPTPDRLAEALRSAGVASVEVRDDGGLAVRGLPMEKVGEAAAAGAVVLHELRLERATLEEAFLAITGTAGAVGVEPPQRPDEVAP
jgi:ABC-2 type transport system ATP-binding protein